MNINKILIAIDYSSVAEAVLAAGLDQAQAFGAEVRIVHAAAPDPEFVGYETGPQHERDFRAQTLIKERQELEAMAESFKQQGIESVTAELVQGPTIEVLLKEIKEREIDLVIMGSHGHGALYNLVVGTVTQAMLKDSGIPVLVIPSQARPD